MNKTISNQWISVGEALPELYKRVLVAHQVLNMHYPTCWNTLI